MFERFTDRARKVVVLAKNEAAERGDDQVRPEHMLYGLAAADGLAARALEGLGVDAAAVEQEIERSSPAGAPPAPSGRADPRAGDAEALAAIGIDVDEIRRRADASFGSGRFVFPRPAFTPRAKEALTRSLSAAETLGDEDIDTQHLLLGLLTEAEGAAGDEDRAATALRALGAEPARLRAQLLDRAAAAS